MAKRHLSVITTSFAVVLLTGNAQACKDFLDLAVHTIANSKGRLSSADFQIDSGADICIKVLPHFQAPDTLSQKDINKAFAARATLGYMQRKADGFPDGTLTLPFCDEPEFLEALKRERFSLALAS